MGSITLAAGNIRRLDGWLRRDRAIRCCPLDLDRRRRIFLALFIFLPLAIVFPSFCQGIAPIGEPAPARCAGSDSSDVAGGRPSPFP